MANIFSRFLGRLGILENNEQNKANTVSMDTEQLSVSSQQGRSGDSSVEVTRAEVHEAASESLIDRALRVIENAPEGLTFNEIMQGVGIEKEQPDFKAKMWELDAIVEDQLGPSGKIYYSQRDDVYRAMDTENFEAELLNEIYDRGAVDTKSLAHTFHSRANIVDDACERLIDAGKLLPYNNDKYRLAEMREDDAKVLAYIKENENVDIEKLCEDFGHDFDTPEGNVYRLETMGEVVERDGYLLSRDVAVIENEEQDRTSEQEKASMSQSTQNEVSKVGKKQPNRTEAMELENQAARMETVTMLLEQSQEMPSHDVVEAKAAVADVRDMAQEAHAATNLEVASASRPEKKRENNKDAVTIAEDTDSEQSNAVSLKSSTAKFKDNDLVTYHFSNARYGVITGRFKEAATKEALSRGKSGACLETDDGRPVFCEDAHGTFDFATEQEKQRVEALSEARDRNKSRDRDRERTRGSQSIY